MVKSRGSVRNSEVLFISDDSNFHSTFLSLQLLHSVHRIFAMAEQQRPDFTLANTRIQEAATEIQLQFQRVEVLPAIQFDDIRQQLNRMEGMMRTSIRTAEYE